MRSFLAIDIDENVKQKILKLQYKSLWRIKVNV